MTISRLVGCFVLAACVSLDAWAWSSSTAWQWNASGRAGLYASAAETDKANDATMGPFVSQIRVGAASGIETLEARAFGFVTLTGIIFEKYGLLIIAR